MKRVKSFGLLVTTLLFGVIVPVQSAYAVDAMQILINISAQIAPVEKMVTAAAYIIGLTLCFRGIYSLKQYAQNVSMMSQSNSMKTPVVLLFTGAMLIYLPTAMDIMMTTTFGQTSILSYNSNASSYYSQSLSTVLRLVQFVGVVSFIRGWMILGETASPNHQGASVGKALTHIFGGLIAVNIILFIRILGNTTGIQTGF